MIRLSKGKAANFAIDFMGDLSVGWFIHNTHADGESLTCVSKIGFWQGKAAALHRAAALGDFVHEVRHYGLLGAGGTPAAPTNLTQRKIYCGGGVDLGGVVGQHGTLFWS